MLSDADRVLVTVVYQRQICSQSVLSDLLGVNENSIGQAIAETRLLLTAHGRLITPSTLRFTDARALAAFAAGTTEGPQRPRLPDLLSDPTLTGMPRADLAAITERLSRRQAARAEGHRHRRRGGERLPGARGGVFRQKITDAERVLATVLYQRDLCAQDTLAELFEGQPTHHRQRRTRNRPAARAGGRIQPRTRPHAIRHCDGPARLPDPQRRKRRLDTSRLILYGPTRSVT